jgi:glycosyltransferase involved in cell wall biosynthesis
MTPRRLLAVCPVDHPGGAETGLLRLLTRLDPMAWHIRLTTPGPGPMAFAAADNGWEWSGLPLGSLGRGEGARAVASWPKARRLARDADVVYLNGTVTGRLLPVLHGPKLVLHVHDLVDRVPPHWRRADAVLADSEAVAARLPGLGAEVVYCPVELDPPEAPAPWPAGDGPVVGFIGRIEPRKGPLDLVLAAPAIRAGRPDARIVLIGDDPYASDPDYLGRVRAGAGVEHCGWVDDAPGVMRHLDVLVVPSREEPFGTVVAEAMAVGTPVVATRVGGIPEVLEDGVAGVLVPPDDPPALAAGVLQVLERHDEMAAAATVAARRFDADAYARRVEALLR